MTKDRLRLRWLIEARNGGLLKMGEEFSHKEEFHRRGQAFMRELARALGLKRGDFEVHSNRGGTAVLGEVSLKAPGLYASLGTYSYFRSATAKDPYGTWPEHPNREMRLSLLGNPAAMAAEIKKELALPMSKDFKPRAKPVGTVRCWQLVSDVKKREPGWVERPRYTDDPLLVVAYPLDGCPLRILHVPTGLAVGLGFTSVKAAAAAIVEIRGLCDWSLPKEELIAAGNALGKKLGCTFDDHLRSICWKHGGQR